MISISGNEIFQFALRLAFSNRVLCKHLSLESLKNLNKIHHWIRLFAGGFPGGVFLLKTIILLNWQSDYKFLSKSNQTKKYCRMIVNFHFKTIQIHVLFVEKRGIRKIFYFIFYLTQNFLNLSVI